MKTRPRPKLTLERTYEATPEEIWELWTSRDGIETLLPPDGFKVEVGKLDLRPGGDLTYVMTAIGREQVEYMTKAGMSLVTEQHAVFVEIDPPRRLVTREVVDFVPGLEPYDVETVLELSPVEDGTHLVLTFDAMHDGQWTENARLGREQELRKLGELLAKRE